MKRAVALVVEPRVSGRKTHLRQPRSRAYANREGSGRDFRVERPRVARLDRVETPGPVRDDAGEHVDGGRSSSSGLAAARTSTGRSSRSSSSTTVTVPGSRMHPTERSISSATLGTDPVDDAATLPRQKTRTGPAMLFGPTEGRGSRAEAPGRRRPAAGPTRCGPHRTAPGSGEPREGPARSPRVGSCHAVRQRGALSVRPTPIQTRRQGGRCRPQPSAGEADGVPRSLTVASVEPRRSVSRGKVRRQSIHRAGQ